MFESFDSSMQVQACFQSEDVRMALALVGEGYPGTWGPAISSTLNGSDSEAAVKVKCWALSGLEGTLVLQSAKADLSG